MAELTVEVTRDRQLPSHALYVTVTNPKLVRVACSPNIEVQTLAVLRQDVGMAVAEAVEGLRPD
jgi:hypothetical protein